MDDTDVFSTKNNYLVDRFQIVRDFSTVSIVDNRKYSAKWYRGFKLRVLTVYISHVN